MRPWLHRSLARQLESNQSPLASQPSPQASELTGFDEDEAYISSGRDPKEANGFSRREITGTTSKRAMHEDSDRDEHQETRNANVNGSVPFMLSALTSSGMVCPSSDSGAGMSGPSGGRLKVYTSPSSLNELIGAVGAMVDDYAARNECETDSLHALVASACCTNKAKLDIMRDSTPWDAYQALNFQGKRARLHPDTPFEQIVEALKADFEEAKVVSPDPVKLERMWMLAWLEQGGRPAERYPSEGIQAARGSVNSIAEGFFKSINQVPSTHAVRGLALVWSALSEMTSEPEDSAIVASHPEIVEYFRIFSAVKQRELLTSLLRFSQAAYCFPFATQGARAPQAFNNRVIDLTRDSSEAPSRRTPDWGAPPSSRPAVKRQATESSLSDFRNAKKPRYSEPAVVEDRSERVAGPSTPRRPAPTPKKPNDRETDGVESVPVRPTRSVTRNSESERTSRPPPVEQTQRPDPYDRTPTPLSSEPPTPPSDQSDPSDSGKSQSENPAPDYGTLNTDALTEEELIQLGAVEAGPIVLVESDLLNPEAHSGKTNSWASVAATQKISRRAKITHAHQDTVLQALAAHPASKQIRDFLLDPNLDIPITFSMDMAPTTPNKIPPGSSVHPPFRKGRQGTQKTITEATPFPACPWASVNFPSDTAGKQKARSVIRAVLETFVTSVGGNTEAHARFPALIEEHGCDIINAPGHCIPWLCWEAVVDNKGDTLTAFYLRNAILCPDPRDAMRVISRHHFDDAGRERLGFINYSTGGEPIKWYHGYSNGTTGTENCTRPEDDDDCPCHIHDPIPKSEFADLCRRMFEPAETATALPIAYEAVLDHVKQEEKEPGTYPGLMKHPFTKQVLAVVGRHRRQGIKPSQSPAYLECWTHAYGANAAKST